MNQKLSTICDQLSEITQWPGRNTAFPATDPSCRGGKASVIFPVIPAFCFDFQKTGKEGRRAQRSRPFEVIYSLIRRNQEAEFEQRFAQNKSSLRVSLKFLRLHFQPRTTKEGV